MMQDQIQEIIGRKVYSGKVLYLVKWKHFRREESTWESVKVLKSFKHFIKEYNEKYKIGNQDDEQFDLETKKPQVPKAKRGRKPKSQALSNIIQKNDLYLGEQETKAQSDLKQLQRQLQAQQYSQIHPPSSKGNEHTSDFYIQDKKNQPSLNHGYSQSQRINSITLPTKLQVKQQSQHMIKNEVKFKQEKKSKMINSLSKHGEGELQRIYFIEKTSENKIQYLVEDKKGNLKKCFSSELIEKNSKELVRYLEEVLLSKLNK